MPRRRSHGTIGVGSGRSGNGRPRDIRPVATRCARRAEVALASCDCTNGSALGRAAVGNSLPGCSLPRGAGRGGRRWRSRLRLVPLYHLAGGPASEQPWRILQVPRLLLAEDFAPRHCMGRLGGTGSNDENITVRFSGPYSDNGTEFHLVNYLYKMR